MIKEPFSNRPERIQLEEYRATLARSSLARPENNFYHWLLSTTWLKFMMLVVFVYLFTNFIFAISYLAFGPGAITIDEVKSLKTWSDKLGVSSTSVLLLPEKFTFSHRVTINGISIFSPPFFY